MRTAALLPAALAAALLAAPGPARAAPPPPAYAALKLGGYFPTHRDVSDWDAGLTGELAVGYKPDPGLALEAGLGWLRTGRGSGVEARVVPLSLGVRGTYPVGAFQPYALLGVGIWFVHEEAGGASDDATSIGGFVGIGGTVDLSRTLFLGLEGRYLFLPARTFSTTTRLDGATVTLGAGVRF